MEDGRIILKAKLANLSPLAIGSGMDEHTDKDLAKTLYHLDEKYNLLPSERIIEHSHIKELPFIPAAGFLGKISSLVNKENDPDLTAYWGESEKSASFIDCSDLFICKLPDGINLRNGTIEEVRDGIRLNSTTGLVAKGAKFDYEVLPPGAEFELTMEFRVQSNYKLAFDLVSKIKILIESGFQVGAKTTNGFGLLKGQASIFSIDFNIPDQFNRWVENDFSKLRPLETQSIPIESSDFKIDATFRIKNSLIIRSYSKDPALPDATHLKSGSRNILSGSSVKGTLRSRAERILNTINPNAAVNNTFLAGLFGDVEKEGDGETVKKDGYTVPSRVFVNEVLIDNSTIKEEIQTRIQIDRFTGGTVVGALLEEVPVFPVKETEQIKNLVIRIVDPQPADKGLLLLLLKDLWTSDLPIGGEKAIGRGVLEGVTAIVTDGNKKYQFPDIFEKPEEIESLQAYVTILNQPSINEYYSKRLNHYKNRKK